MGFTAKSQACHHPLYGAAAPEHKWVPSPSYLLRRARVLDHLQTMHPGAALEIGCGAGGMIADYIDRGWHCWGVDRSPSALAVARSLHRANPQVELSAELPQDKKGQFDLVSAFEVLEHIEDDIAALSEWASYLKPTGRLMLSVPAHRRRWNATDVWAGHIRRYDKNDLLALFGRCGLKMLDLECYGFPLGNVIEPVRARLKQRQTGVAGEPRTVQERTDRSGIERSFEMRLYPFLDNPLGELVMRSCFAMQKPFRHTDLGVGFLAVAALRG